MVALPNIPVGSDEDLNPNRREVPANKNGMRRAITACAGAALIMAAAGLWFVPSEDSAAQLIKLFVSAAMLCGGLYLFHGLNDAEDQPEVQIDTKKRQLRIYEYDRDGRSVLAACHDIDALTELSLTERTLRARAADGQLIVSMPVPSGSAETRLRQALRLAA